jgi:SAM-dependent methyltransferase
MRIIHVIPTLAETSEGSGRGANRNYNLAATSRSVDFPACPACGCAELKAAGEIPPSDIFAGRRLSEPLDGGWLFSCKECHLSFRFPRKTQEELDALYQSGSIAAWSVEPSQRVDWKTAIAWAEERLPVGSSVLDVGCFDGSFLKLLGSGYRRFGIEIHPHARKKAAAEDVIIIGRRYEELAGVAGEFDAIFAFDLIEHIHDPVRFLTLMSNALRPSGILVVSSGNSDAGSWRLMGAGYWYCAISEHISFVNPRWCEITAPQAHLHIERLALFSHCTAPVHRKVLECIKNLVYRAAPRGTAWMRRRGFGHKDAQRFPVLAEHPPSWMSARDHFMLFARKTGATASRISPG